MNAKGFTLIELMIAVVIVGVLSALGVSQYQDYLVNSRKTEARLSLAALYSAQQILRRESGAYRTCLSMGGLELKPDYYTVGFTTPGPNVTSNSPIRLACNQNNDGPGNRYFMATKTIGDKTSVNFSSGPSLSAGLEGAGATGMPEEHSCDYFTVCEGGTQYLGGAQGHIRRAAELPSTFVIDEQRNLRELF